MNYYYKNKEGKVFTNTGSNPTPVKWGVKYDCYPHIDRTTFNSTCGNAIAIKDGTDPNWSAAWVREGKDYGKYRPTFICCFKEPTMDVDLIETSNWNDSNLGPRTGYYPSYKANQNFHCFEQINFYYGKEDLFNQINLDNCSVYEWNAPVTDLADYSTTGSTISNSTLSTKTKSNNMYLNNSVWYWNQPAPEQGAEGLGDGDTRYKIIKFDPKNNDYKFNTQIVKLEDGKFSGIKILMSDLSDYTKLKVSFKTTQNVCVTSYNTYNDIENYINNGSNYRNTSAENPYYGVWFFSNEDKVPQSNNVQNYYYCKSTLKTKKVDDSTIVNNDRMISDPLVNNEIRSFIKYNSMPCYIYTREDFENGKNLYITEVNFAEEYNDQTSAIEFSTSTNKIATTTYYSKWPDIKQGTYLSSYFEKYPSLKEFMKTAIMLTGYGGSNGISTWFYNHQDLTGAGSNTGYSWTWGGGPSKTEVTEYPTYFYPVTDYSNNYVRSVATLENCHYEIDLSENDGKSAVYILYPMMTTLQNESTSNYEPIYSKFQMFIEGIK